MHKRSRIIPVVILIAAFSFLGYKLYNVQTQIAAPLKATLEELAKNNLRLIANLEFDDPQAIKGMKEKVFRGKTKYEIIVDKDKGNSLKAISKGTSSLLYTEVDIDMNVTQPILTWEWKVLEFPSEKKLKSLAAKSDNDYAGRVYAMFKGSNVFNSEVIQYVWDDHYEVGDWDSSPYSKNVRIMVVQKGFKSDGGWASHVRNVASDYRMLFGKEPDKPLSAIGLMSDSDNTRTQSGMLFSHIRLEALDSDDGING
ncbi:MAG: hypothetical protein ACI9CF_000303 [Candidatus Omnitrophota bacterium]|jgi:hypothetical protein